MPLIEAIRDYGVALAQVFPGKDPFEVPDDRRPTIMVVGDDFIVSLGPSGFNRRSLKRFIRTCSLGIIVPGAAVAQAYTRAACAASGGANVVLVETRPQDGLAWQAMLLKANQRLKVVVSEMKEGADAQPSR